VTHHRMQQLARVALAVMAVGAPGAAVAQAARAPVQQGAPVADPSTSKALAPKPVAAARADSSRMLADAGVTRVTREAYTYDAGGRRDPFFPLILTSDLRPLLKELVLTSVIFDPSGRRSVAVMRDKTGQMQYRVTTGMLLGRMRVLEIRPKAVFFTIQEFGSDRRDSLLLVDTTKVRSR